MSLKAFFSAQPQINFFMPDDMARRGGGDWDPREEDDSLAAQFKVALRYQLSQPSMTADPYGLSTLSSKIMFFIVFF